MGNKYAIEAKGIVKQFPGVLAVDQVNFGAHNGCVHAVVGENGAGKTTLMKILYGLEQPDQGNIYIHGNKANFTNARDAINAGIGMVHQHFMLIPSYTVTENIILGQEVTKNGFLDFKSARARVKEISNKYGLQVDPDAKIRNLPVGIRQRIEILKLLYRGLDILIFDEPTAVLTPQEVESLFKTMRSLVKDGKTIILITHKLREVLAVSDYVSVLRRGRLVGSSKTKDVTIDQLANMMVGREMQKKIPKKPIKSDNLVLSLRNVNALSNQNLEIVKDISINVNAGEIVTLAGVEGNGQTEIAEIVSGMRTVTSGEIWLENKNITGLSVRQRRDLGIGFIPEDRMDVGLCLEGTLEENFIIGKYHRQPYSKNRLLNFHEIKAHSLSLVKDYDIRVPSITSKAQTLSGGNLQKVVVAREFSNGCKAYIIAQPTRGVDIGSQEFIHKQIIKMREQGAAILLVSTDLDEVFMVSDRILVLYQGEITGEFLPSQTNREEIGLYMTGIKRMELSPGGRVS